MISCSERKNKLNAHEAAAFGLKFDSKKEAGRFVVLRQMQAEGKIHGLKTQVKFLLTDKMVKADGTTERASYYIADFVYEKDGQKIVEDVKGYKGGATYRLFALKRKIMLARYGIEVKEV